MSITLPRAMIHWLAAEVAAGRCSSLDEAAQANIAERTAPGASDGARCGQLRSGSGLILVRPGSMTTSAPLICSPSFSTTFKTRSSSASLES